MNTKDRIALAALAVIGAYDGKNAAERVGVAIQMLANELTAGGYAKAVADVLRTKLGKDK